MKHIQNIVIGAGVSGLSAARLLHEQNKEVLILEKANKPGGLIKCDRVEGHLFHRVGGHVFNSRNQEIKDWFWKHFNQEETFLSAKRKAGINIQNKTVGYPIENYLYQLDDQTVTSIINELMDLDKQGSKSPQEYDNFEAFLKGNFGEQLFKLYFEPYNHKIWKTDLSKVALPWLDGKLPMPNYRETILSNILRKEEGNMVHSSFYYPKNNGSQFIADTLAQGTKIIYNTTVDSIVRKGNEWIINDAYSAENIIYTGDIRQLNQTVKEVSDNISAGLQKVKDLKSNGTSNLLCTVDDNDYSWMYLPEQQTPAHRIIFTGNFSKTNNAPEGNRSCTIEFSGYTPKEEMLQAIKQLPFNPKAIAHNYEPNSYVIQQNGDKENIDHTRSLLQEQNFHLCGRFAEWEYHNMDKAIESAMRVVRSISC